MQSSPAIAVVTQPTRLKGLRSRWATASAAKFRLKRAHAHVQAALAQTPPSGALAAAAPAVQAAMDLAEFEEYEDEDLTYEQTLERLKRELDLGYPLRFVDRGFLANFHFGQCVMVVVLGQDGLVANTAKYVARMEESDGQSLPIVAINPDPKRIDGVLLPFNVRQAGRAVRRTLENRAKTRDVTLAEVKLNDGQTMLAFNDFFVGVSSHVSARYTLRVRGRAEPQSSSGMIIATGAGSTGWLSSMFNMVNGFSRWLGGNENAPVRLDWEDRRLIWAVREPFQSKHSRADLVAGLLEPGGELVVESLMPSGGVIFSDGIEADYLEFITGTIATFSVSRQSARLVVG
jgi:hypothetical protein